MRFDKVLRAIDHAAYTILNTRLENNGGALVVRGPGQHTAALSGVFALLVACASPTPQTQPADAQPSDGGWWACPEGWVASAHGGCGPAVVLCASGGNAAPGACDGLDLRRPTTIVLPDGGTTRGFYLRPDGNIGGGWPEPGDPEGPPAEDWLPDAVRQCIDGGAPQADGTCGVNTQADCGVGSAAVPGGRCTRTSECPVGMYPEPGAEAVGAALVHVRAESSVADADGSVERPFASIAEALRRAGDDGWVLVAQGAYNETVQLGAGARAHILGACATRVTLRDASGASPVIALQNASTSLDLRGITVTGGRYGVDVSEGATLRADGVAFTLNRDANVRVRGADTRAELTACRVYAPANSVDPVNGRGVVVRGGARVDLHEVNVANNRGFGVDADGLNTQVMIRRSLVRDTREAQDVGPGIGISVTNGAALELSESLITGNTTNGVLVSGERGGPRASGSISATRVRLTSRDAHGTTGHGLVAWDGALLRATGVIVDGNQGVGVVASGVGTSLEMREVFVRGIGGAADAGVGVGVHVTDQASAELSGVVCEGSQGIGVAAFQSGTHVDIGGSVVRGALPTTSGAGGVGVYVSSGAELRVTRSLVSNSALAGIVVTDTPLPDGGYVRDAATTASLNESIIRGAADLGAARSDGVSISDRARVTMTGVQVLDCVGVGVLATSPRVRLGIESSAVRHTQPYGTNGTFGRGLEISNNAVVTVAGLLIEDSHEIGVAAVDGPESLVGTDVLIRGVRPSGRGFGVGLYAFSHGGANLTRLAITDVHGAGLAAVPRVMYPRSVVNVRYLYVRGVSPSTVQFDPSGMTAAPVGDAVSYGLFADLGTYVDVQRALIEGTRYGFFNASGTMFIRQGVIGEALVSGGAIEIPSRAGRDLTSLQDVTFWGLPRPDFGDAGTTPGRDDGLTRVGAIDGVGTPSIVAYP